MLHTEAFTDADQSESFDAGNRNTAGGKEFAARTAKLAVGVVALAELGPFDHPIRTN